MAKSLPTIHYATTSGDLAEVQRIVALGGEIEGNTKHVLSPLLIAVRFQHKEIVKYLLEQGASVNKRDPWGSTPLHLAAFNNDLYIVKLLIQSGADVYLEDSRKSMPIHVAAKYGHFKVVEYFLSVGVVVNFINNKGYSLLHAACRWRQFLIVKNLVENGADVNRKLRLPQRFTPLNVATMFNCPEIAELLILNGADLIQAKCQGRPILSTAILYSAYDSAKVIIKYSLLFYDPVNIKIPNRWHVPKELRKYYNLCLEEIEHMKKVLIKNSNVSLHQIICDSFKENNNFTVYLRNDNIINELNTIEDYLKDFDIYGNIALMQAIINKSLERLRLFNGADLVMKKIAPKLPSEIRWKILDYLNMSDLTAVIQSDIFNK